MKRFVQWLCRMSWHQWNYEKHFTKEQQGRQEFVWMRRCERCEREERFSGIWISYEQGNGTGEREWLKQ